MGLDDVLLARLHQPDTPAQLRTLFFDAHEQHYGYHNPQDAVEIINYRLTARGRLHQPSEAVVPDVVDVALEPTPMAMRQVYFTADVSITTPVFDRTALAPGHTITGPAVIEQLDATTLVYPDDQLRVDPFHNLLIEVSA